MTGRLKIELVAAALLCAVVGGVAAWHQHGVAAAQEALAKEHKAETEALVAKLSAESERKIAQANQANAQQIALLAGQIGQLNNRMVQLSDRLIALQQAEAAQLAEIQRMTTPELIGRLRTELGPPEGPIQAVPLTQKDLVQVDTWKVERDTCQQAAGVKDEQLQTCKEGSAVRDETIRVQNDSIILLNGAVEAQKQIVAANAKQYEEDLKAKKTNRLKWAGIGALFGEVVRIIFKGAF